MSAVYNDLIPYVNKCEFPFWIIPEVKKLGIDGLTIKDHGGAGFTQVEAGSILHELGKKDASIGTFIIVHNALGTAVLDSLGNEEQRARLLKDSVPFDKICCFGLTEPNYGSDATSLKTTAKKVDGGYLITGEKTWIGNAPWCDYLIIWARNEDQNGKIQAFVVTKGSKGLSTTTIQNKYALRMVQNGNIFMKDVFVPDNNRLTKADSF